MNKTNLKDIRVLMIEDNQGHIKLIKAMLEENGVGPPDIESASRLSAGLDRLKAQRFDVLLLDLGLPDSNGIETVRDVIHLDRGVPIIVLTGHSDEFLGLEALKEGAQDYLLKGQIDSNLLMRSILYAVERQRLLSELHSQSLTDFLTSLNNRRGFFTLAEQQAKLARREKKCLALIIIDIDDFKKINDTFGHKTGDKALVEAAQILKETFRDSDVIGRIGGDEFAICVIEDGAFNAGILVERLRENLMEHNGRKMLPCTLSFSTGTASCSSESLCSVESLVSEADRSMYAQKKGSGNRS